MSKISRKLADKTAAYMAGDLFRIRFLHIEEQLAEALTDIVKNKIPSDVFRFIRLYPDYISTTEYVLVYGSINGKKVSFAGRINILIPDTHGIEVDEKTLLSLQNIVNRMRGLLERRFKFHVNLRYQIYECKTTAKLKQVFPEAYTVLMKLKNNENS